MSEIGSQLTSDGKKMRFGVHVLLFNTEKWILRMIENCGPFVDKIYVAYSKSPWTYSAGEIERVENASDLAILQESRYRDKIVVVEGEWELDEDTRNECLKRAKDDGMNFLIAQDADEFYEYDDYAKMIKQITENPDYEIYTAPMSVFWKSFEYVIENEKGEIVTCFPAFAINCGKRVKFKYSRVPDSKNALLLDSLCFHGSYVLTDDEVLKKIGSWAHANEFDRKRWFKRKWLNWSRRTRNLHPINPCSWKRAVSYNGKLPRELIDFPAPQVNHASLKGLEFVEESTLQFLENQGCLMKELSYSIRKIIPPWAKSIYKKITRKKENN